MMGLADLIRQWWQKLKEWIKPDPADHLLLKGMKLIGKCVVLLVLLALSPVLLVVLLFVFLAAV
jgi:hypothetical protein